ncbi:MAG: NAD(P)/FAD-dependent oxidoreductase [Candidatus Saliniplasma sp.]
MDVQEGEVLNYDIVVVGGGPAGNTAARFAAREGADVLVLEKRQEIGSPVRCAEGVSLSWLEELEIENIESCTSRTMKGAILYSPAGNELKITEKMAGDEVGVVLERDLFDKEMARLAGKEGADFMVKTSAVGLIIEEGVVKGVEARSMGKKFEVRADLVIGADGFESQVGRWAGIYDSLKPKDIMTCFQYRMTGITMNPDYTHFYMGSDAPGGYVWVFPKGENMANVGLGIQLSRVEGEKTPKDYLDDFLETHEHYSNGEAVDMVAGAVAVTHPTEKVTAPGIILVGDAARVVDPMTGGGIVNSLKQGKIAGEFAAEAVKKGRVDEEYMDKYEERWRDKLENKLWRNYMAKETATNLDDETFDKIIDALSEFDLETVTIGAILEGVKKKYPELVEEFQDMI